MTLIPEYFPVLAKQEERFEQVIAVFPNSVHTRIRDALAFATNAHGDQLRKGEARIPYIIHPIRVACTLVDELGERDVDAFIAALLHDVIEDCDVSSATVHERFGSTVGRYVDALTWVKGTNEKWTQAAAMLQHSRSIRLVKASDIIDNARSTWSIRDRAMMLRLLYGYAAWGRRIVQSVGKTALLLFEAAVQKSTTLHFGKDPDPPFPANSGKRLVVRIADPALHHGAYARYPIPTHVITRDDMFVDVVRRYALPYLRPGDLLAISERVVAITQGRAYRIEDIRPTWLAKYLCRFVTKNPGGIGLASPWTMELALREAGRLRMLLAAAVAALTRPLGLRGLFYRVAGHRVNAIDGPCDYTLPPYNRYATLGPADPRGVAELLAREIGVRVAIIDANDLGVEVLGASSGVDRAFVKALFRDNPLGQSMEQTPMAIARGVTV